METLHFILNPRKIAVQVQKDIVFFTEKQAHNSLCCPELLDHLLVVSPDLRFNSVRQLILQLFDNLFRLFFCFENFKIDSSLIKGPPSLFLFELSSKFSTGIIMVFRVNRETIIKEILFVLDLLCVIFHVANLIIHLKIRYAL